MSSIIIPAHNEAAVIARCLHSLLADVEHDQFRIFVVCNGCTDDTPEVAKAVGSPAVTVLTVATASKAAALNAGDEAAGDDFPRLYIDADVVMGPGSTAQLARHLADGRCLVSAPSLKVNVTGRPWMVRRYYTAFLRSPWVQEDLVGSGVYAVSRAGWHRISPFPPVLNDDKWVFDCFRRHERRSSPGWFQIEAPRTVESLVNAKARVRAGERELTRLRAEGALPARVYEVEPGGLRKAVRTWLRIPVSSIVSRVINRRVGKLDDLHREQGADREWRQDTTTRVAG